MEESDLFLSYSSADLAAAEALEAWLQAPPRDRTVWRDRRGVLPGAPDYYPPILAGISASAAFVLLLSPRWLHSSVAAQELSDAQAEGKKIIVVVHSAIPRDPATARGRERKTELMQALQTSGLMAKLERPNWIWPLKDASTEADYSQVEQALATDFAWAARHAVIVQRLNRWNAVQDDTALLRGTDLVELMADAFADAPGREPALTEEQRRFLLDSQRHDAEESEREQGLYWGAQARATAFAARERGEAEPDLALLLAAEGASVATVPEARAVLLSLLHRHARLTGAIQAHGSGRSVTGVAFSPDARWIASVDQARGLGDDRRSHLLLHEAETGSEWKRIGNDGPLSAVAWGERWLAVASPGSIGWLHWDDWKERFRGNTPTALNGDVAPTYLAFSPAGVDLPQGELLAWGTQWGDIGLIHVGSHVRSQGRLGDNVSSDALSGLGWLSDGRLITAEGGRILARPVPELEPAQEIASPERVFSLVSDGKRWVAACRQDGSSGLLIGDDTEVLAYWPAQAADLTLTAVVAGPTDDPCLLSGTGARRSGAAAVALWNDETRRDTLLQGEDEQVTQVAADPSGRFAAAGDMQGRLWLWDRNRRTHLLREALPGVVARGIAASRAEHTALATVDGRVMMLGPSFAGDPVTDAHVAFEPSRLLFVDGGRTLLAADQQGQLAAVGADGDVSSLSWPRELGAAPHIAVASGAPIIAALGSDGMITILRLAESRLSAVRSIDPGRPVLGLALDPTGQHVYAVVERLGLDVVSWRVDATDEAPLDILSLTSAGPPPVPIAFPRGDLVVIADGDDLVFVPLDTPEHATRHRGHDEPVKHIAAGSDVVASVACWFQDTDVDQIRLFTADGHPLGPVTLPEHAGDIALSPDGSCAMVLGDSGTLWRATLRTEDWINAAQRIAGRALSPEEERRHGVDAWRARSL